MSRPHSRVAAPVGAFNSPLHHCDVAYSHETFLHRESWASEINVKGEDWIASRHRHSVPAFNWLTTVASRLPTACS
jgi:hypothetical protein